MTDYTELANRIIGYGVGRKIGGYTFVADKYEVPSSGDAYLAREFVCDGRVVLAMLQKVRAISVEAWCALLKRLMHEFDNKELAIAMHTACCDSLDEDKQQENDDE